MKLELNPWLMLPPKESPDPWPKTGQKKIPFLGVKTTPDF
jgi:hypothetical protein